MDYIDGMQTIVELPEFIKKAEKIFTKNERASIINYLASNPASGVLMQGTGGIRKLRWAAKGKGKSGGSRVVYYFHNEVMPLFVLTVFGKNEKVNLTKSECNEFAKLTTLLVNNYGAKNE